MDNRTVNNDELADTGFVRHLKNATAIVREWPEWKQAAAESLHIRVEPARMTITAPAALLRLDLPKRTEEGASKDEPSTE